MIWLQMKCSLGVAKHRCNMIVCYILVSCCSWNSHGAINRAYLALNNEYYDDTSYYYSCWNGEEIGMYEKNEIECSSSSDNLISPN